MSTIKVTNIQATGETASRAVSGVAAARVNFDGTGTVAIRESSNTTSITDNGTGDYSSFVTSSFDNGNYTISGTAMYYSSTNSHIVSYGDVNGAAGTLPSTSGFRIRTVYINSNSAQDCEIIGLQSFGDLA